MKASSRIAGIGWLVAVGAGALQLLEPNEATAACTQTGNPPGWTCTTTGGSQTTRIGSGPNTATGAAVMVNPGAQITVGNQNAISLGDNVTITIGDNARVTNNGTSSTSATGLWNAGPNTIEFGSNGVLTIGAGAIVTANGSQNSGEPINVMGTGNTVINRGTVTSRSGAALWFEDRVVGQQGNTIDNYGVIETQLGANSNVIGNQGASDVTFINRTGATVRGSLSFAGGNDTLTLETGSVITGGFNGGGGTNTLSLSGAGNDSLAGDIRNFQTLNKTGEGRWTLTGAIGANGGAAALQVFVNQGTLALTGNNANFNGSITVNSAGTLEARAQSLPPTITDNGLVRFVQDTAGTYAGTISGAGAVEKTLGGTLTLSGTNSYSGGTTINAGTISISSNANLGPISGGLTLNGGTFATTANISTARATTLGPNGGTLSTGAGTTLTQSGVMSGSGNLTKAGTGTLILTGTNSYTGTTIIDAGTLQVASNGALGGSGSGILFSGGTLRTTISMSMGRTTAIDTGGGTIETLGGTTLTWDSDITGAGTLVKSGAGTLHLTGTNSQAGGTTVTGGVLQVTRDGNLGAAGSALTLDGGTMLTDTTFAIDRGAILGSGGGTFDTEAGTLTYNGVISGSGGLTATGAAGNTILTGNNTYTGSTTIAAGYLVINGDQSAATGLTTAQSGGRLSGSGIIGGDVEIEDGGILAPGYAPFTPATLTINGDLRLSNNSNIFYNLRDTTVGGALNDLTVVHGNLTLDGVVNVLDEGQNLGPGVYRIINYDGTLTDNGLEIGGYQTQPGGSTRPLTGFSVQTVVPGQVNLINTTGLALNYWDGSAAVNKNNNIIEGGNGTWFHAGPDATSAWTDPTGAVNAPWADGEFAIFIGAPGVVNASNADGQITVAGMQFGVNGYLLQGEPLQLVGSPDIPRESIIRVGDGTAGAAAMTATISVELAGNTQLRKTDLGTLILSGANSYSGGTRIEGGAVQVTSDANLGAAGSAITLDGGTLRAAASFTSGRATTIDNDNGTIDTASLSTLTLTGAVGGTGALTKGGEGTLLLTADASYSGGTTIANGTLQLGNGGTSGSVVGPIIDNGTLVVNRSNVLSLEGLVSGTGSLVQAGAGTTILTADNSYTGGTTISAGTLQLGNGGASGSVVGPIVDNGVLAINRSDEWTLDSLVSGSGSLVHSGTGTTVLTGNNSYAGNTTVSGGRLYIDGDQSGALGAVNAQNGTRLGGSGIIGGDVTIEAGATLSPGPSSGTPGILTINGDLNLADGSSMLYNLTSTVVGGPGNDLTIVRGDLTLDGAVNVLDVGQTLGPGVYRLINYDGALVDNVLDVGIITPDGTTQTGDLSGFIVQTAIRGQVNLVNTSGLALNYWDGNDGPKNDGFIDGGDGIWRTAGPSSTSNWTDAGGSTNAPWGAGQFAIFTGTPGTVEVLHDNGAVLVSGMQFATDGYVIDGEALTLVGGRPNIRVGDGTSASAAITATINAELTGGTGINKTDLGTLVLGGTNTFTGGVTVNGGTVQISSDANLGGTAGDLVLNGGTLRTTADIDMTREVNLFDVGGTLETTGTTTLTLDSPVTGNGALTKAGSGSLVLTADASYTGGTTIGAGTLQLGNGGTAGGVIGDIIDNGALVVNRSNELVISGVISGSGTLEQVGTGTTVLTNDSTYTGGTTISDGTLQIGNGGTTGHVVGDILNNSILVVNRSDTKLTPGVISGSGQLIQRGMGTLVLQADNTYAGGTTIEAGRLQLGDGGTAGAIVGDAVNEGVLAFNRSDEVTFAGVISGSGSLEHLGTGKTILTGANSFTGGTTVAAGTLQVGDGGTSGQIFGDILNNGVVILNRSDDILYEGSISGTGATIKEGAGTLIATGTGTYTGGTTISDGVLQLGNGGTSGSVLGNIVNNAGLAVNRSDSLLLSGTISGTGSFEQMGPGTTIFEANNTYTGGTLISQGTLQIGNGGETGLVPGDVVNNGKLVINRSNTKFLEGVVSGTGELVQAGLGTLIITNANSYSGGTAVESGTLQISSDANLGDASGGLRIDGGTLATTADMATARSTVLGQEGGIFDTLSATTLTHDGEIDGAGSLTKAGDGTLVLSGTNAYSGPTDVQAGTLLVDGDQSAASGPTTVASKAALGGSGTIGGDVTVGDGGILTPGGASDAPGTLTIAGDLTLSSGSILQYEFGQANVPGGPLNDLTEIGGDLVLDGTINVTVPSGGSFDPGIYRVFNYSGTLTDNGLTVGEIPAPSYFVQTSVAGQVNLVNTTGLTLNYWDGAAGPKNDGVINGRDGIWQNSSGNDNWTTDSGSPNAPFADGAFAIFTGAPGTVTVDASLGSVSAQGLQFAVDGYVVQGDAINLIGSPGSLVRVGDGTPDGAAMTATIHSELTGNTILTKSDLGTLILTGANSYTGGTAINGGVVQIASDANLGAASGDLSFNGGALRTTGPITTARTVALQTNGGTFETIADLTLSGVISGNGNLTKTGAATLTLTGAASHSGGTTISAGTLQVGNGGTTGSITGNIVDNSLLVLNRSDRLTLDGTISGSGSLVQAGTGTTILTGANSYTGRTRLTAGTLLVNGDQRAASGLTSVAANATLGGTGIIGGSVAVADAGTLAPGGVGSAPGTLTIGQVLALSGGSQLAYNFGQANVVGGPLNDLAVVGGDLVLDGTINVSVSEGGSVDPGVYRVISYAGGLTNNGLEIGMMPSPGFVVQTSVTNQINLVNTSGLTLNFWDGAAGPKNDGVINGGDGLWQNSSGNDNWTTASGTPNAPFTDAGFAIFQGSPGTVTVDASLGPVNASGMQFAVDSYVVRGDAINLVGTTAVIRVGDGTNAGAGMSATIDSVLTGNTALAKSDLGTLILTGANTYTGGTVINGGVLQVASDANLGTASGGLGFDGGTLRTTDAITTARGVTLQTNGGTVEILADLTLGGTIGGSGGLTKAGVGTLTLTGANSYAGPTVISAGSLYVEGNQVAAIGPTSVAGGATLGGGGTLGGSVTVGDNGRLSPGTASGTPGVMTIGQNLALTSGSRLAYSFGQANVVGGPYNDLTVVNGDLVLDGSIDITLSPTGSLDPGVYRVISYGGTLTNNGLAIGAIPSAGFSVQTSIANQVNLINTSGLTLNFWDGAAGPKNDGIVNGGNGLWQNAAGNDNWTTANGIPNAPFTDAAFAIFQGSPGTVTVDASLGSINAAGMQFAADGYVVQGDAINLVGTESVIRVGDGTAAGASTTATVGSVLTGSATLIKSDLGTLVLTGANTYAGGTAINDGVLQIASDANLGAAAGAISIDGATLRTAADISTSRTVTLGAGGGTFETQPNTTLTLGEAVGGAGGLTKSGGGRLVVLGPDSYTGPTSVAAGTLQAGATDSFSSASQFSVLPGATLDLAGFDQTIAGLTNAGTVRTGGAPGTALSVAGNYIGNGGSLALNTHLGDDSSISDRLVIDAGTASGNTSVVVTNVGGQGAPTTGNGILLIGTANGGTTMPDAFFLGGPTVAGPYEYSLYRGGIDGSSPENWYLRSVLDCDLAPSLPGCGEVPPPPGPQPPAPPAYRPETSLYTAIPSLALDYGNTLLGTLDERMGIQRAFRGPAGFAADNLVWGRIIGSLGSRDGGALGIYGNDGPSYDYDIFAIQTGLDLYRQENADGSFDNAGIYFAYGHAGAEVEHFDGIDAGSLSLNGVTLGGYWTHYGATGWYFDGVIQGTWYDIGASGRLPGVSTDGLGFAASLETGYPFHLENGMVLEPQAQLTYQAINLGSMRDIGANVRFDDVQSLVGRVGIRLSQSWGLGPQEGEANNKRQAISWIRGSITNEFLGEPTASFSSEDGYVPFQAGMKGAGFKIDAGFDAEIADGVSIYGNVDYQRSFDNDNHAFSGKLGLKARF
ncbi:autotransporter-associated beta strand repeat-containing protein [Neorhizobium sp. DT-125]|uniref:autotransporter-associated beta strand repeat-containing protein n=1 Tax=Neorhizobium sp. DT-125 TaxID=3396163 RepID=UPI003F1C00C7